MALKGYWGSKAALLAPGKSQVVGVCILLGGVVACSEAESWDSVRSTEAGLALEPARLSPELEQQLTRARRDDKLKVSIYLTREAVRSYPEEWGEGETSDKQGTVVGTLNGRPATLGDFANQAESVRATIAKGHAEEESRRSEQWRELASKYSLEGELRGAIESGAASIDSELPVDKLTALAGESSSIRLIGHHVPGEPSTLSGALASIGVSTVAHPAGWKGWGQSLFLTDFHAPQVPHPCVNSANLVLLPGTLPASPSYIHATQMTCLAQAAAPQARVAYGTTSENGVCGSNLPSSVLYFTPPVWVSSQSIVFDGLGKYAYCDTLFDDRILSSRIAHFGSTGNRDEQDPQSTYLVRSPAVAYNVISVGAFNHGVNPYAMVENSLYADPETGAHKPEIVGPGGIVPLAGLGNPGGTSVATPLAAGFALDLLQQFSFLRGQPALLKAWLMVNSIRVHGSGGVVGSQDGAGRVDYGTAQWGAWAFWNGPNSAHFTADQNGNGKKEIIRTLNLTAGVRYRAFLSWLVDGTYYAGTHRKPNMDLDLIAVSPSGAILATSGSWTQTYEVVEFTAPVTGTYTFRIERFFNGNTTSPVSVGLVVRAR